MRSYVTGRIVSLASVYNMFQALTATDCITVCNMYAYTPVGTC